MGRVRFFDLTTDRYVSLRVEQDGVYLNGHKLATRKDKHKMPPKGKGTNHATETSPQYAARIQDDDLLEKILAVLADCEQTFKTDSKAMVTVKPAYKKSGYDFSFKFREDWDTHSGESILEAILGYYQDALAE